MFNKKKIFHKVLEKAKYNTLQFRTLLNDSQREINKLESSKLECAEFINTYYQVDLTYGEMISLGRFIENGEYINELNLYF